MSHLPRLDEPWVPSTRVFVYLVGVSDGPDESMRDAFVFDESPYTERAALRTVLRDVEDVLVGYHLPWERRQVQRDEIPTDLPVWSVYRAMLLDGVREYFALLLPGGTRENPSGLLRRMTVPSMSWGESLWRNGRWRRTEYFHELSYHQAAVGDVVEISEQDARTVVARWQAAGLIPDVDFEKRNFERGKPKYWYANEPSAPTHDVTEAESLAYLNNLFNDGLPAEQRSTFTLTEFEYGFLVWRSDPLAAPGSHYGESRTVIDKASGLLSIWPSFAADDIIEQYNRLRAGGGAPDPVIHPETGIAFGVRGGQ